MAFSVRYVPSCYKQDRLGVIFVSCWWLWQVENPDEGERPPLKADIRQRLVKTVTDQEHLLYLIAAREVQWRAVVT
jgi:hypothetical protein